jgi:hypothetical protein
MECMKKIERIGGNVIYDCWNIIKGQYNDVFDGLYPHVEPAIDYEKISILSHVLTVILLGSFQSRIHSGIGEILETETKKIIDIWSKRIVVAALRGTYNIW